MTRTDTLPSKTDPGTDPGDDVRWQAVQDRDAAADGRFVYAVRTTGVYCRPTCPSRRPKRANVGFFDSGEQARAAGFRPCKRCHPDAGGKGEKASRIERACRLIQQAEEMPGLEELASAVGLSPFHFHRQFKEVTGLTPRAYAAAWRAGRLRDGLVGGGATVTEAFYDAGFNTASRFYAKSAELLGMSPGAYRAGGEGELIRFALGDCSLGALLVAASERGVCAILLGDDAEALLRDLQDRFPRAELLGGEADFDDTVAQVVGFVEAPEVGLDLPLDLRGTAFQQRVWSALSALKPGETVTYGELAARLGQPKSHRAVASACAANPLAIAIPCHRVVRTDGGLAGYRWGIERKRALLKRESAL
ncbi:MAG: bifunctional DNA-binding transcriptional regulator/O6-methylguanine-DNA methyltransferase Ada [Rhodospirillales bacterium]